MNILEPQDKIALDDSLKSLFNKLKFKRFPIVLKGSSSLKSQRYFSDYDLFSSIKGKYSSKVAFKEFSKILSRLFDTPDVYFTELKLQTKDGNKYKWFPFENFNGADFAKEWDSVDFVKLDCILRSNNRFIEVSIIYKFSVDKLTKTDYVKELEDDIEGLKKENKYYKILKRLFSIAKLNKNKELLLKLNSVFNSNLGALYQKISNLEAIKLLLTYYKDDITKKKAEINLKDIKEDSDLSQLNKNISKNSKILNKSAKEIYDKLK